MARPALLLLILLSIAPPLHPQAADDQQVLVPFDTAVFSGLFGSEWSTELWVRNESEEPVNLFPETCSSWGISYPCAHRIDVPAKTTLLLDVRRDFRSDSPGVLLYVPPTHSGRISFDLRLRVSSLANGSEGVSIPVLRESDYRTGESTLLNVVLRPGFRTTLRVYSPEGRLRFHLFVRVWSEPEGNLVVSRIFAFALPTDAPSPPSVPLTIDLSSVMAEAASRFTGRVRVTITPDDPLLRYWPLLSMTSNDTNHVTIVVPQ